MATLTMPSDSPMEAELTRLAKSTHRSKGDLAREMLRRQMAVWRFPTLRAQSIPYAEVAGNISDEDVFRDTSWGFSSTAMRCPAHCCPGVCAQICLSRH